MKIIILISLITSLPAFANDGYGALGAGGIVYGKSGEITIKSEVLTISEKSVTVKYLFLNEATKKIDATVAFPLPDITCGYWGRNTGMDDFSAIVDGKAVTLKLEEKAFNLDTGRAGKKDLTEAVRAAKLPMDCRKTYEDKKLFKKAQKVNLADNFKGSDPEDVKYVTKRTYYWKQEFPSKKEVQIEHAYTPIIGEFTAFSLHYYNLGLHCDRDPRFKWVDQGKFETLDSAITSGTTVQYILTTAKTWKSSINSFNLILKKTNEKDLICTTLGPLTKINSLTYEFKTRDFIPDRELTVIFGRSKQ